MSVTTVAAPVGRAPSASNTLRLVLAALAVVALLAVSFAVGRVTASTSSTTTSIVPAAHTGAGPDACPRLRAC
jgi:hypothetical protein